MFTGKSGDNIKRNRTSTAKKLSPKRRFEVSLENSQIQQFADWLDEQLASLVEENANFESAHSNRMFFGRF